MLPPLLIGPVCRACGQPGAHGTVDECLVVLRRAATYTCDPKPTAPVDEKPVLDWLEVRAVSQQRVVFYATSVAKAIWWITLTRRRRGVRARNVYWIQRMGVSAARKPR